MAKKVLIIDDENFFIEPIKLFLKRDGIEVIVANDGLTGLKMARSENPDLIVVDLMLPGINGYQVCRLLKFDNQYRHIPILIVSARDTEHDQSLGKESGADRYLTKPIDPPVLAEEIQSLLSK